MVHACSDGRGDVCVFQAKHVCDGVTSANGGVDAASVVPGASSVHAGSRFSSREHKTCKLPGAFASVGTTSRLREWAPCFNHQNGYPFSACNGITLVLWSTAPHCPYRPPFMYLLLNLPLQAPIHNSAPTFEEQGKSQEILVTGIKVCLSRSS